VHLNALSRAFFEEKFGKVAACVAKVFPKQAAARSKSANSQPSPGTDEKQLATSASKSQTATEADKRSQVTSGVHISVSLNDRLQTQGSL